MDKNSFYSKNMQELQDEYRNINGEWLRIHYAICLCVIFSSFLVEVMMGYILMQTGNVESISRYILKYILTPTGINVSIGLVMTFFIFNKKIPQEVKIYIVSLEMLFISLVLYSVHKIFIITSFMFAVSILLTMIYAEYLLTSLAIVVGMGFSLIGELLITWDPDVTSVFSDPHRLGEYVLSLCMIFCTYLCCMIGVFFGRMKNEASIKKEWQRLQLLEKVNRDDLTGVQGRRALHEVLRGVEEQGDEQGDEQAYILVVTDLDHFKLVNDHYGHQEGDNCIIHFARILEKNSAAAAVFRYGGDEFCLLFRGVTPEEVKAVCRKLQEETNQFFQKQFPELAITASFGLASFPEKGNAAHFFVAADQALYEAKKKRNHIIYYSDMTESAIENGYIQP